MSDSDVQRAGRKRFALLVFASIVLLTLAFFSAESMDSCIGRKTDEILATYPQCGDDLTPLLCANLQREFIRSATDLATKECNSLLDRWY